jgi:hypothetical protein
MVDVTDIYKYETARRNRFMLSPAIKSRDSFQGSIKCCDLPSLEIVDGKKKLAPINATLYCYLSSDPFLWFGDFWDNDAVDFDLHLLGSSLEPVKTLKFGKCDVEVHFKTLDMASDGEVLTCDITIHPRSMTLPDGRSYELAR